MTPRSSRRAENYRVDFRKKRAHKLKKNPWGIGRVFLGHPAGQPGVYRPVSQGFPVVYFRKKSIFAGTPARRPTDTRPSRGFSGISCDFSYVGDFRYERGVAEGGEGDTTPQCDVQCLSAVVLWHPDRHANATSLPL